MQKVIADSKKAQSVEGDAIRSMLKVSLHLNFELLTKQLEASFEALNSSL
jgi:hypothetical protein